MKRAEVNDMKVASHIWVSKTEGRQPEKSHQTWKAESGCTEKVWPITIQRSKVARALSHPELKREVRINKKADLLCMLGNNL